MTKSNNKAKFIRLFAVGIAAVFAALAIFPFATKARFAENGRVGASSDISATITEAANGYNDDVLAVNDLPDDVGLTPKSSDEITVIVDAGGTPMMQYSYGRGISVAQALSTREGRANLAALEAARDAAFDSVSKYIIERRYDYSTIMNAFSATVKYGDVAKIEASDRVVNVIISDSFEKPEAVTENYVDVYETGIFNSSGVGYDGTGTVAAVLDTGTDYSHEAFDMVLDESSLAISKDDVAAVVPYLAATSFSAAESVDIDEDDLYLSSKLPFAYDYADSDTNVYPYESHGTHVAGIIAGKSERITGVAPKAQIATFKVFPDKDEGASQEGLIAALNDAVALGVDVINMSLGSSCGFSREGDDDAINEVYDAINAAGICLVVAASNSYSSAQNSTWGNTNLASNPDSGTIGSPASYPASLAVASVSGVKTRYFTVNGTEVYFNESRLAGKTDPNDFVAGLLGDDENGEYEYVVVPGIGLSVNYSDIDVNGKIAVVRRGTTSFEEKVRVAAGKGAKGVIVYNNVSGTVTMSVGTQELIPSCFVSMDLAHYLTSSATGTIRLSKQYLAGPFMSDFSSWGVLPDLGLSPDITAHGGDIVSAVAGGNLYDTYSGTSMASPNLAGALILVRQYVKENNPDYNTGLVRDESYSRMMSTATIVLNEDGNPYSPRKQGAGLADIANSLNTKAYLTVDGSNKPKLSLGDDPDRTGEYTLKFNIVNISGQALSYNIAPYVMTETMSVDERTVAEKAYLFDDTVNSYSVEAKQGSAYMNGSVLSVSGYGEAVVTVKIKLGTADKKYLDNNFVNGMYVEGYVRLESYNKDNIDLSIPYLAFYGDWTDAPMLDVTAYDVGESAADDSVLAEDKLVADVFGTLPLAGIESSTASDGIGSLPMGQFSYIPATGFTSPEPQEKYASLTTNRDGSFMLYAIAAGLLRGAKKVDWEIRDSATGDLLKSGVDYNARKSYANGEQLGGYIPIELDISELGLANNAKYTFSMTCHLDKKDENGEYTYGNKNKFSFEFTVDNEAPQLVRASVRESEVNGSKSHYLDLTVYDNHYIQGFSLGTYTVLDADGPDGEYIPGDMLNLSDGVIPITSEYRANTTVSLDISAYWDKISSNGYKMYVSLYDYANNARSFEIVLDRETDLQIEKKRTARDSYTIATNGQTNLKDFITVKANPDDTADEADKSYVEDYWYQDLEWESSDPDSVAVRDGLVTGLKPTTEDVVITVKVAGADDSQTDTKYCLNFKIKVTDRVEQINITGVKMSVDSLVLERGETYTVKATVEPYNYVGEYELEWASTSANVIIIPTDDPDKVTIKAVNSGAANIRATVKGGRVSGYCSVYVQQEYTVYETVYLRKYTGRGDENGVVDIPDNLGISYIYNRAFFRNEYITEVTIPEGVTTIMEAAFVGCTNLRKVNLPSTIEKIEPVAFYQCENLEEVTGLGNVKNIGEAAFYGCSSLDNLDLSTCTYIGDVAFFGCENISSLDLSRVGIVGGAAFAFNDGLTELTIPSGTSLTTTVLTSNGGSDELEVGSFAMCANLKKVTIESANLGVGAFVACENLKEVIFKNNVNIIGADAFAECTALDTVVFEGSAYKIGDYAFMGCTALKSFTLPAGLTVIGSAPFVRSGIETVTISKYAMLTDLEFASLFNKSSDIKSFNVENGNPYLVSVDGVVYDKDMIKLVAYPFGRDNTSFTVPSTVKTIGTSAFYGVKNLVSVDLGSVEYVEELAFASADKLTTVTGFENVKYIGAAAFSGSPITMFPFTDNVEYIGDEAFAQCTKIAGAFKAPKNLEYLGNLAFMMQQTSSFGIPVAGGEITSVSFAGSSVKEMGVAVFAYNRSITSVDFGDLEIIGDSMFAVNTGLKSVTIPDTVKKLGDSAFVDCTNLATINLGKLKVIPEYAFGNTALTNVTLPEETTVIGDFAFAKTKISTFDFANVTELGDSAFANSSLSAAESAKITKIGARAFAECSSLAVVDLPAVKTVGEGAFSDCGALGSAFLGSATDVGADAFKNCKSLFVLMLTNAKTVGANAFSGATELAEIALPALVSLGGGAFDGTAITSVSIPATAEYIADDALLGAGLLGSITVSADNANYFAQSGVLYRKNANGYYTLICYPAAKIDEEYTVVDLTVKLGANSFSGNANLKKLTLPAHLQVIGAGALDGTVSLEEVRIYASDAVTLESGEDYDETPKSSYNNFGAVRDTLKIIVPSNAVGYDSRTWKLCVGNSIEVSETSLHIAMGTLNLITRINALPEEITTDYAGEIASLKRLYGILNAAQRAFVDGDYSYTSGNTSIDGTYYTSLLGGNNYYEMLLDAESRMSDPKSDNIPSDDDNLGLIIGIVGLVLIFAIFAATPFIKMRVSGKKPTGTDGEKTESTVTADGAAQAIDNIEAVEKTETIEETEKSETSDPVVSKSGESETETAATAKAEEKSEPTEKSEATEISAEKGSVKDGDKKPTEKKPAAKKSTAKTTAKSASAAKSTAGAPKKTANKPAAQKKSDKEGAE